MSSTSGSWRRLVAAAAGRSRRRPRRHGHRPAGVAVPDRDAVPPPELARDAPVADVLHPVQVELRPSAPGRSVTSPVAHGGEGRLGQRRALDEPLLREVRLDDRVAALAVADGVQVRLHPPQQPRLGQGLQHRLAGLEAVQPGERPARSRSSCRPRSRMLICWQAVPLRRSRSRWGRGPGVTLTAPVPNAGSTAASAMIGISRSDERQAQHPADQAPVALVVRVDGHGGVAEHGLGPGGGHRRCPAVRRRTGTRCSPDSPVVSSCSTSTSERAVWQRGHQLIMPCAAVDEPLFVEADEDACAPPGESPSSMVKRSRAQSQEAPRRLRLLDDASLVLRASTPRPARRTPRGPGRGGSVPSSASSRSTTFCVAMPAWSVPGSQRAS